MKNPAHYPLATDKACYVGDGVAVVVADEPGAREDAVELVDVDYEPLDAVIDLEDALSDRADRPRGPRHQHAGTWSSTDRRCSEGAVGAAFDDPDLVTVKERVLPSSG